MSSSCTRQPLANPSTRAGDPSEEPALVKMGKQLVAARTVEAGQVLTADDVAIKSPGGEGLLPYELDRVIGRKVSKRLSADEPIKPGILWS